MNVLPEDSGARKGLPITTGVYDYFPNAIAEVAGVSKVGNDKHNGEGTPLRWTFGVSDDHADCISRHLVDRGNRDASGVRHSAYIAWRALALLEAELIAEGATPGRAVVMPTPPAPTLAEAIEDTSRLLKEDERRAAKRQFVDRRRFRNATNREVERAPRVSDAEAVAMSNREYTETVMDHGYTMAQAAELQRRREAGQA
jgi:hypothetical protein